jgi:hypothetical protein
MSREDRETSTPSDTLVFPIHWSALIGDPLENPELSDILNTLTVLSPDDIRQFVENFFDEISKVSAKALRAINKIADMMDDLDQWDFAGLIELFDTKTPINDFIEHSQDMTIHLTDDDRAEIGRINDLSELVDSFLISLGAQLRLLQNTVNAFRESLNSNISNLSEHIADDGRHFTDGDEKTALMNSALNFDSDLLMKGCTVTTEIEELENSKIISEVAYKHEYDELENDTGWEFARRDTTITADNITVATSFNIDGLGTNDITATSVVTFNEDINGGAVSIIKEVT